MREAEGVEKVKDMVELRHLSDLEREAWATLKRWGLLLFAKWWLTPFSLKL